VKKNQEDYEQVEFNKEEYLNDQAQEVKIVIPLPIMTAVTHQIYYRGKCKHFSYRSNE